MKTLEFRWTVSRARDTDGYNRCTLFVDRQKVSFCVGGGYDMEGTCLGEWIQGSFPGELKTLESYRGNGDCPGGFYGLTFFSFPFKEHPAEYHKKYQNGDKVFLDGGCGMSSMQKILDACGYVLRYVSGGKNRSTYVMVEKES